MHFCYAWLNIGATKTSTLYCEIFKQLLSKGVIDSAKRLLLVGMPGPETARIHRSIREGNLTRQVMLVSGISDAEMQWCYRNCDLLLAPSIIEGFGLPVAEALLAGCRVVCSDIPSFREVGGSTAATWGWVQMRFGTLPWQSARLCGVGDHRPFRFHSYLPRSLPSSICGSIGPSQPLQYLRPNRQYLMVLPPLTAALLGHLKLARTPQRPGAARTW